jgi:hypothetical protein
MESLRVYHGISAKEMACFLNISYKVYLEKENNPDKFTIGELKGIIQITKINPLEVLKYITDPHSDPQTVTLNNILFTQRELQNTQKK